MKLRPIRLINRLTSATLKERDEVARIGLKLPVTAPLFGGNVDDALGFAAICALLVGLLPLAGVVLDPFIVPLKGVATAADAGCF